MQCHKCPYSEQNGGTLQDRKRHCLTCDFTEVYSKPAFPIETPLAEALINRETLAGYNADKAQPAEPTEEDVRTVANCEFVKRFGLLNWRSQQVVLGLLNVGDSNKEISGMTHLAVSTIIEHRKRLEADSYWRGWLGKIAVRRHTRRKRSTRPPAERTHDCNGNLKAREAATV